MTEQPLRRSMIALAGATLFVVALTLPTGALSTLGTDHTSSAQEVSPGLDLGAILHDSPRDSEAIASTSWERAVSKVRRHGTHPTGGLAQGAFVTAAVLVLLFFVVLDRPRRSSAWATSVDPRAPPRLLQHQR